MRYFTTSQWEAAQQDFLKLENSGIMSSHVGLIFHTEDVDELYSHFKSDASISELVSFENDPTDALWGERFFHIRDPDGYQLHLQCQQVKKQLMSD
jgi:uncharacterized glyoxalase superfamily protein PhnB